jgi:hypothetical protein
MAGATTTSKFYDSDDVKLLEAGVEHKKNAT